MRIQKHPTPPGQNAQRTGHDVTPLPVDGGPWVMVSGQPGSPTRSDQRDAFERRYAPDEQNRAANIRWPKTAFPLTVFIAGTSAQQGTLWPWVQLWETHTAGRVAFQQALSSESADITIDWTDMATMGRDYEVGHANRTVNDNGWITQVAITLLRNPVIDQYLTPAQQQLRLKATILHEIGHALGLEHATSDKDVMHYRGWQNSDLSSNNIQRLIQLYSQ